MYELIVRSLTYKSTTTHLVTKEKLQEMVRELSKIGKYSFQYKKVSN